MVGNCCSAARRHELKVRDVSHVLLSPDTAMQRRIRGRRFTIDPGGGKAGIRDAERRSSVRATMCCSVSGEVVRVAVIGSGPAGIYTAQALTDPGALARVEVDVYDQLPVPYGLVRYGVAPDHPKMKSIIEQLRRVLERPGVRFLGNVRLGRDLTLAELRSYYDAVVVACGASADRRLAVPGEELPGCISATEFVSWYSGHPDAAVDGIVLTATSVAIVGAGNVALDVARMLLTSDERLRATDVPEHVLRELAASPVRDVYILARRGVAQAKFTSKELHEIGELADVDVLQLA